MVSIFKHLSIFLLPPYRASVKVETGQYIRAKTAYSVCTQTAEMLCHISTLLGVTP